MNFWQKLTLGVAAMLLAPGLAGHAQAASVSGHSSTVLEWFDTLNGKTAVPLYQYLMLNVTDIADAGYDLRLYGRVAGDTAGEASYAAKSRLYHLYLDKQGLGLDNLDVRLGRQFISTSAGASVMDGLRLDYGFLDKKYRLTLFGGGDVAYYQGYNAKDAIVGGRIAGTFFETLDLGLSHVSKWDGGNQAQQLFGFDAELKLFEKFHLYNELQYDYLSDRISYALVGARYYEPANWGARLEYLYSLPVFSATSIFSVFAVSEYEEILAELTYNFTPQWRGFGRYTREMYPDFKDANVFEAGIEKLRGANGFGGYLSGVWRDDSDGQDLRGFKAYLNYLFKVYEKNLLAGAGAQVDVLERKIAYFDDEFSGDETTSSRLWIDGTAYLTRSTNLQVKVERVESYLWNHYYQGRVRLNVLF